MRAERMVQRTEVVRAAEQRARQVMETAEADARRLRHETEDFLDQRLGSFEILLDKLQKTRRCRSPTTVDRRRADAVEARPRRRTPPRGSSIRTGPDDRGPPSAPRWSTPPSCFAGRALAGESSLTSPSSPSTSIDARLTGDLAVDVTLESTLDDIVVTGTLAGEWSRRLPEMSAAHRRRPGRRGSTSVMRPRRASPPTPSRSSTGRSTSAPMIHEEILLAIPDAPLCRPDCPGLCPLCGADLGRRTVRV